MRKEVSLATLHGTIHTPTSGQLGVTLETTTQQSKVKRMSLEDGFLFVETKADGVRAKSVTIAVPLTNVSHLVFAEQKATVTREKDSKS